MRRITIAFVMAAIMSVGIGAAKVLAAGNVCVWHNGHEIWVDDSAVPTHLENHQGDHLCIIIG